VTSNALARGFEASVAAAFGIVAGNVLYFAASALGVGALILATGEFFAIVKWLGVAWLLWLGVRLWLGRASFLPDESGAARRAFRDGVLVQLSNPKNLIFFIAILPPFIDVSGNVPLQVLVLGVTSQVIEIIVLLTYGAVGARAGRSLRGSRFAGWLDPIAGSLLIGVAAALALVGRSA